MSDTQRLEGLAPEWSELCDSASEPNPFYRPELLIPALQLGLCVDPISIVFVRSDAGVLIGVFPFQARRPSLRKPMTACRPLIHRYCFVQTAIVRKGFSSESLRGLGHTFGQFQLPSQLLFIEGSSEDAAVGRAPIEAILVCPSAVRSTGRPVLRQGRAIQPSNKAAKEYADKRRKLDKLGVVHLETVRSDDPRFDDRLNEFLELEHRGWKAKRSSSLKSAGLPQQYFDAAIGKQARSGLWIIESLCLDNRPIAMQLNLMDGGNRPIRFGFKSAFDDRLHRYSPGAVLLNEQRLSFYRDNELVRFDSCADPDNLAVYRLWPDRLQPTGYYVAPRSLLGRTCMAAIRIRQRHSTRADDERVTTGNLLEAPQSSGAAMIAAAASSRR